jgi:hypothetical protein
MDWAKITGIEGLSACDASQAKVGRIQRVVPDKRKPDASWALIRDEAAADAPIYVPLFNAKVERSSVRLNFERKTIYAAPRLNPRTGALDVRGLLDAYGLTGYGGPPGVPFPDPQPGTTPSPGVPFPDPGDPPDRR